MTKGVDQNKVERRAVLYAAKIGDAQKIDDALSQVSADTLSAVLRLAGKEGEWVRSSVLSCEQARFLTARIEEFQRRLNGAAQVEEVSAGAKDQQPKAAPTSSHTPVGPARGSRQPAASSDTMTRAPEGRSL